MEKKSYYLIILLVVLFICAGVFIYQFNNNVATFMIINETEISEGGSFSGLLMDAYSYGVSNQTVTLHEPGSGSDSIEVTTDENGEFTIEHAKYVSDGDDNYYGNFTFAGNGKYQGCVYEGNVSVTK